MLGISIDEVRMVRLLVVALAVAVAAPAAAAGKKDAKPAPPKASKASKAPEPVPAPATEPAAVSAPEAKPAETVPAAALPAVKPELPRAAPGAMRVAVLDPKTKGDVPERALAGFVSALVPELRKLEGVSSVGMSEVRDMLAFEKQRQLLGCGDDSCLAEIGGALGVDEVVTFELLLNGNQYALSSRRLNMKKAMMVSADSKVFDKRDGTELLAIVGPTVEALYPERPLKEGKTRGVDEAVIKRFNPPPLPKWVFIATGVAAVASAGAGGAFSFVQAERKSQWDYLAESSKEEPVPGADLMARQRETQEAWQNSLIFYGVAGGLAVVAAIEAVFTDWHDDRLGFAVGPTGVGVSGKF